MNPDVAPRREKTSTFRESRAMSALPPKADMVQHDRDVRFVPKADISHCSDRRLPLVQVIADFRQQLAWTVRLRHEVVAASRSGLLLFRTWRIGGDRDDGDR